MREEEARHGFCQTRRGCGECDVPYARIINFFDTQMKRRLEDMARLF